MSPRFIISQPFFEFSVHTIHRTVSATIRERVFLSRGTCMQIYHMDYPDTLCGDRMHSVCAVCAIVSPDLLSFPCSGYISYPQCLGIYPRDSCRSNTNSLREGDLRVCLMPLLLSLLYLHPIIRVNDNRHQRKNQRNQYRCCHSSTSAGQCVCLQRKQFSNLSQL